MLYIVSVKDSVASCAVRTLQLGLLRDKFTQFFFLPFDFLAAVYKASLTHSCILGSVVFKEIKELTI